MIRKALAALALLSLPLAGCVNSNSTGVVTSVDLPAAVATLTVRDLKAADADAKAHNDTVAATCYEAVIPLIGTATAPKAPAGLISAFQDLRDGRNGSTTAKGLVKQLEVPCGPLAADVNLSLIDMITMFAGASVPGASLLGVLPGL